MKEAEKAQVMAWHDGECCCCCTAVVGGQEMLMLVSIDSAEFHAYSDLHRVGHWCFVTMVESLLSCHCLIVQRRRSR